MIASRILTVLAAVFLVAAFALATMSTADLPLGQALLQLDDTSLTRLHHDLVAIMPTGIWDQLVTPLLIRPVWLLPAMVGIVFCGLALSFRPKPRPTTRRRSN